MFHLHGSKDMADNKIIIRNRIILAGLLVLCLLTLSVPALLYASDISDADYYGRIVVTNNGSDATNVATVGDFKTQDIIDGNYLNATANNCAIVSSAGADIPFMPGYADNVSCLWVSAIASDAITHSNYYTGNVTGGTIRYFPDAEGMTSADSATSEPSGNWTMNLSGYVDTTAGYDKNLIRKPGGIAVYVSDNYSGNVTAEIYDVPSYASPTDFSDNLSVWSSETNAYDSNNATHALCLNTAADNWTAWLELTRASTRIDRVIVYFDNVTTDNISIQCYYNDQWNETYNGTATQAAGAEYFLPVREADVTNIRVSLHNGSGSINDLDLNELWYGEIQSTTATLTGITSAEHEIEVGQNSDNGTFYLSIDGSTSSNATGVSAGKIAEYENYKTGDSSYSNIYAGVYRGQTFTPSISHFITHVGLYMNRDVGCCYDVTVNITATDGSVPIGDALTSVTFYANDYGYSPAQWREHELDSPYYLVSGTKYAIALSAGPGSDGDNKISWRWDWDDATYTGGNSTASSDYGATWTLIGVGNGGFMFYEKGFVLSGVPDTSANWTFLTNNAMPYMEYYNLTIDGDLKQSLAWNYGDTFEDLSAYGNDATPTFRTATSSANVTAELVSFVPVQQAILDDFDLTTLGSRVIGTPVTPGNLYGELVFTYFEPANVVNDLLDASSTPRALWWFPVLYISIAIIGFIVYGATRLGGANGSLFTMCVIIEICLALIGVVGICPYWPAILFPIPAAAIVISQKHFSWG